MSMVGGYTSACHTGRICKYVLHDIEVSLCPWWGNIQGQDIEIMSPWWGMQAHTIEKTFHSMVG